MKKLFLFSIILLSSHFALVKAQWVTIPDAPFVIQLTQQFPSCMNGNQMDTTCTEILNTTVLNLMASNISNLSGIKYFVNLITLNCNYNALTTLPALPNNLVNLNCSYNQLTSITSLPNTLQILNCSYNQLTSLPTVPNIMAEFKISNNNISCLYNLPEGPPFYGIIGSITNNPLTCVPNQTSYTFGLPECLMNDTVTNPNNCPSVFKLSGNVFTDENNNCLYDVNDIGTSNIYLKLYDSLNALVAQNYTINGAYSFFVNQLGTYHIKLEDNLLPIAMDCGSANSQTVSVTPQTTAVTSVDFPVICDTAYDIYTQSVNKLGIVFPGQFHLLNTNVSNNEIWYHLDCNSNTFTGVVSLQVTGPVTYISPLPGALIPQVNGNNYIYTINNFDSLHAGSFGLKLMTDTTAQAGNQICVHVQITSTPLDADSTNNVYDFCYNIVNSYDPNMKEVYPVNVLPGYDDWFTYTIHFQNTGNAPAINIRLKDTLDTNLDFSTFEMVGYSHPANVTLSGNVIAVKFNNIMLPDSTSDYEGSMGYFQYRLKPMPNMPAGTKVENTAYIYFDYNASIVTNTTLNNFETPQKALNLTLDEQFYMLYPNPSNGLFMFKDNKNIKTVEVFNMLGEMVLSQGNAKQINLQAYPKGVYVARVNGTQVCRLVKE